MRDQDEIERRLQDDGSGPDDGAAVLMATGKLGDSGPRFTISVPGAR